MATAKQRLDKRPRPIRQKLSPVALDDPESFLRITDEKQYRAELWLAFARFARERGGIIVSRPSASPARVLVPLGDGDSQLEIAMCALPKYRVTKLMSTATRLSQNGFREMAELEITLWPGS